MELIQTSSNPHHSPHPSISHAQTDSFFSNVNHSNNEIVKELKNKISSQNEQIEVLVSEVQSLRGSDSSSSQNKNDQISKLYSDLAGVRDELAVANTNNGNLQRALADAQNVMREGGVGAGAEAGAGAVFSSSSSSSSSSSNANPNPNPDAASANYERTVFEQTSKICDLEVSELSYHFTPVKQFNLHPLLTTKLTHSMRLASLGAGAGQKFKPARSNCRARLEHPPATTSTQ